MMSVATASLDAKGCIPDSDDLYTHSQECTIVGPGGSVDQRYRLRNNVAPRTQLRAFPATFGDSLLATRGR